MDQAEEHYTKAVELDGRLAAAYANRALVRLKLGDPGGAEADCDRTLLLQPAHAKALLRRATARYTVTRCAAPSCAASGSANARLGLSVLLN